MTKSYFYKIYQFHIIAQIECFMKTINRATMGGLDLIQPAHHNQLDCFASLAIKERITRQVLYDTDQSVD